MQFSRQHYKQISDLVFQDNYPGYKKNVIESPNGDGKFDTDKRYAHIATKYLDQLKNRNVFNTLNMYFSMAHAVALQVAHQLQLPEELYPHKDACAMRVLEYAPGVGSYSHTDFNLFTLMMYRDQPDKFVIHDNKPDEKLQKINKQLHIGELLEIEEYANACRHSVQPSETHQHSIVFFALPNHLTILSNGQSVGEWLEERMSRSRKEV